MSASFWFTFLLLLVAHPLLAQTLPSRNISLQQGLPEYYVSGIVQDKAGFIWIATRDGLARYDGRRFKLFRHQVRNGASLANNVIVSLQTVSDSALLLRLENGAFQLFNPETEQFKNLLTKQRLDQEGLQVYNSWISPDEQHFWGRKERQLIHYSPRRNRINRYALQFPLPDGGYAGNELLLDSTQERIYAPFPGGIMEFDTRTGQHRAWPFVVVGQSGTVETYYGISAVWRSNGELLTIAPGQLIAFQPRSGRFRAIPIPNDISTNAGMFHAAVDGNTYFTYGMTVYRLTPDDRITPLWTAPRLDYQNYFHALLLDRSGVLWVGTNGDGVHQIDLRALPITTRPYRITFMADLLSVELGLRAPDWAKANDISYLLRWSGEGPYLAGWGQDSYRLLRADKDHRQLQNLLTIYSTSQNAYAGNGLRATAQGHLWFYIAFRGLFQANRAGRVLAEWSLRLDWVSDVQPLGSLIWISSEFYGLYAYDPRQRRMVHHLRYGANDSTSIVSDNVWCLAADPHNPAVLWVGTQEGLSRLDTRTMRCRNWTEQEGLPNATINCLLTDRRGYLWFSTLQGISRLDPRTGRMRHFTTEDGLLDIEYRRQHGVELPDGRLAFGGATGMTVFNPLALKDVPQQIPIALTALRIGNVPIEPRRVGSPLTRALNATPALHLNYTQNFLSIEFAGLQYNKPTTIQYRYQLTGVDADWVYAGNQNIANYTQLAPGTYEFRVNAGDALGRWSRFVKTIRIDITPPWWRTWWFYILSIAALLSGIYVLYRYRLAQVLKLRNLRNEIARDLHDEVGSSISTIAIYSKIVLEQVEGSTFKSEPLLVKITEQANEIMESMNDIVWSINTKNDAFEKVFTRMREHAFQLFEAKGYTLHFDFDETLYRAKLDMEKRRDFYLIYKEALNNIAKYANGQNVWISVRLKQATIDLVIRDDGQGFEVNAARNKSNGLGNMQDRAAALKGTLRIDSAPGAGTTLHLTF